MDDERPRSPRARLEVVPEQPVRGALALPLGGDAEQPRWLVDHDDGRVLVDELEVAREGDGAATGEADSILGAHGRAAVTAHAIVDLDSPGGEPLLEATA